MNRINGIARGGSPCVLAPPSLAPEEQVHLQKWDVLNAHKITVYCWGKNSGLNFKHV